MILHTVVLFMCLNAAEGFLTITPAKETIIVGDTVVLTCESNSSLTAGISWRAGRYGRRSQTTCFHTEDLCVPYKSDDDDRYTFTSDVANRKFKMTITEAQTSDSQTLTCTDSSDTAKFALTVPAPTISTEKPDSDGASWWFMVFMSILGVVMITLMSINLFYTRMIDRRGYYTPVKTSTYKSNEEKRYRIAVPETQQEPLKKKVNDCDVSYTGPKMESEKARIRLEYGYKV